MGGLAAYKRQMIVSGDVFYVTFPALAGVSYSVCMFCYYIPITSSGILRETNVIAHGIAGGLARFGSCVSNRLLYTSDILFFNRHGCRRF